MDVQKEIRNHRWVARIVGMLFLAATATYIIGDGLIDTLLNMPEYLLHVYPNRSQMITGVLFKFVAATANVCIGVLLFPILKQHSERIALGYMITRIFDGAGVVVSGTGALALIPLSQAAIQAGTQRASDFLPLGNLLVAGSDTAFVVTMLALGLGAIPFCYLLYRSRLIPRSLSVLGLIGYVALLGGSVLELSGFDLNMIHYLPGGLFELILPIWLIARGFNVTTPASLSARTQGSESESMRLSTA